MLVEAKESASSPKAIAHYLVDLRPFVQSASGMRNEFVREIGMLMEHAKRRDRWLVAQETLRIGREQGNVFRRIRAQIAIMKIPDVCVRCHQSAIKWLEKQIATCDLMVEVGTDNNLGRLQEAHYLFAEGRIYARQFNSNYQELVQLVRTRVNDVRQKRIARRSSFAS